MGGRAALARRGELKQCTIATSWNVTTDDMIRNRHSLACRKEGVHTSDHRHTLPGQEYDKGSLVTSALHLRVDTRFRL